MRIEIKFSNLVLHICTFNCVQQHQCWRTIGKQFQIDSLRKFRCETMFGRKKGFSLNIAQITFLRYIFSKYAKYIIYFYMTQIIITVIKNFKNLLPETQNLYLLCQQVRIWGNWKKGKERSRRFSETIVILRFYIYCLLFGWNRPHFSLRVRIPDTFSLKIKIFNTTFLFFWSNPFN